MTSTPLRRLVPPLAGIGLSLGSAYAAVIVVLLPAQVARLETGDKVRDLAVVTTVAFAVTLFAQPVIGALSDRTVARTGTRAPWVLGSGLVALGLLVALGDASSVLALCVLWALGQFALNGVDVASSAVVPDQVPRRRRGTVFAAVGTAALVGAAVGVLGATRGAGSPVAVHLALGLAVVAASAWFVVADRGRHPGADLARATVPSQSVRAWVRQLQDSPGYTRAFVSRLLFVLAYYLVYAFQLYVLTDHLGLTPGRAAGTVALLTVVSLTAILVGAVTTGALSDRLGDRRPFMAGACALLALAVLAPLVAPSVAGMVVFAVLKGLAFGAYAASGTALVTEVMPEGTGTAGRDLGVYNVATNIPQTLAPSIAAVVVGSVGGYPALFVTAALVAVAALVVTVTIPSTQRVDELVP